MGQGRTEVRHCIAVAVVLLALCAAGIHVVAQGGGPPAMTEISAVVEAQRTSTTMAQPPAPVVTATTSTTQAAPAPVVSTTTTAPPPTTPSTTAPGPAPSSSSRLRALPPGKGGTWAVVLGVDDYGGRDDLEAGVADADEVAATLRDAGVPDTNVLLLRDREVTHRSITTALDWLVDNAGPDALAVFFWAGHVRALGGETQALATSDGANVTDAAIAARLSQLRARRSWFLIAGCFGGGFTELLGPGRLLTAASTRDQEAYESTSFGHSYLVEYVVRRALHRREGPRVVSGAVSWGQSRLRRDHPGREPVSYVSGPVEPFVLGPDPTPTPAEAAAAG